MNGKVRLWRLMWIAPLAILGMVVFAALGGYVVMRLWNWLTPAMFGWHVITFWQALGLLVLVRLLFGGLGLPGRARAEEAHGRPCREGTGGGGRVRWGALVGLAQMELDPPVGSPGPGPAP